MKLLFAAVVVTAGLIIAFGSPLAGNRPVRDFYYDAPKKILPMNFAHQDHVTVNCVKCHHNFVDDTGGGLCMNCHVTNRQVWPLLEYQFHHLCRDCHAEKAALGENGGPPRQCMACHTGDDLP